MGVKVWGCSFTLQASGLKGLDTRHTVCLQSEPHDCDCDCLCVCVCVRRGRGVEAAYWIHVVHKAGPSLGGVGRGRMYTQHAHELEQDGTHVHTYKYGRAVREVHTRSASAQSHDHPPAPLDPPHLQHSRALERCSIPGAHGGVARGGAVVAQRGLAAASHQALAVGGPSHTQHGVQVLRGGSRRRCRRCRRRRRPRRGGGTGGGAAKGGSRGWGWGRG